MSSWWDLVLELPFSAWMLKIYEFVHNLAAHYSISLSFVEISGKKTVKWRVCSDKSNKVGAWRWLWSYPTGDLDDERLSTSKHCRLFWQLLAEGSPVDLHGVLWRRLSPGYLSWWVKSIHLLIMEGYNMAKLMRFLHFHQPFLIVMYISELKYWTTKPS